MSSRHHGIQYGFGERVITPSMTVSLAGYFGERIWDSVLDDISVKALFIAGGDSRSLIVICDLCYVSADAVAAAKKAAKAHGVHPEHVLICATHSHTAPALDAKSGGVNAYNSFLCERTKEAIDAAAAAVKSGRVAVGSFEEPRFAYNRRFWMKNGAVMTNPGKCNPDIDKPESGIDAVITLAGFYADERLDLLMVNISNHVDTIGGNGVSADWPGILSRSIQERTGASVMVCISPSGNINHFNTANAEGQTDYGEAKRIGEGYAAAILQFMKKDILLNGNGNCSEVSSYAFRVLSQNVRILPRAVSAEAVANAKRDAALTVTSTAPLTSEDLAKRTPAALKRFAADLLEYERNKRPAVASMTAVGIGDLVMLSMPGEPFHEVALALRAEHSSLIIASLAGADYHGYIPLTACFDRGGYETTVRASPCAPDTADRITECGRALLRAVITSPAQKPARTKRSRGRRN